MISTETTEFVSNRIIQMLLSLGFGGETILSYHLHEVFVLLLIAFCAWTVDFVCRRGIVPIVQRLTLETKTKWDDYLFNDKVLNSFCHLLPSLVVYACLPFLFPKGESGFWGLLCFRAARIYIAAAGMRLIYVFLSGLKTATNTSHKLSGHFISGFIQLAKLLVTCVGLIVIIGIITNRSPLSLFAGLGVAATVLMLVFKDTLTT